MKTITTLALGLLGFTVTCSQGAILPAVPMQGTMVMPKVAYRSTSDSVEVAMPPHIPQLTPLLISHPDDSFDPADPWFDALDPSQGGASFSRRYGFVMDATSDQLPENREMWIRKLSASPELGVYRNENSDPKVWEPIFGTDASPTARYWNQVMFHPAFTAQPGTNPLTATFEVYLIDTGTGLEVPSSGSGPLVFDWTNVSDGRPVLRLAWRRAAGGSNEVMIAWPATTTTNWILECATNSLAGLWIPMDQAPEIIDGESCVVTEPGSGQAYYRMRHVP
jgi:hypothetical protein